MEMWGRLWTLTEARRDKDRGCLEKEEEEARRQTVIAAIREDGDSFAKLALCVSYNTSRTGEDGWVKGVRKGG